MNLAEAEALAKSLLAEGGLGKHFVLYKVCGSIRRQCEVIGDIDIVGIPRAESSYVFGEESLTDFVERIDPQGRDEYLKDKRVGAARYLNGKAIKRFQYQGQMIDLYIASRQTFETLVLIRTGSADHNRRLATLAKGKGLSLLARGDGLCRVHEHNGETVVDEVIDNTENGILYRLLGSIPIPEKRS